MSAPPYLAGLRLDGRRVVVVGGGHVLARRLPTLLDAGAELSVVAPHADAAVEAAARAGRIVLECRRYAAGDLADAWYAMAATDDPAVNAAVVAEAQSRRIFCVRADDGRLGTAVTPATGTAGDAQVGVLAAGDFRRSRRLRDQLLRWLSTGS